MTRKNTTRTATTPMHATTNLDGNLDPLGEDPSSTAEPSSSSSSGVPPGVDVAPCNCCGEQPGVDSGIENATGMARERLPELLAPGTIRLKHGLIYAPRAVALTGAGTGHYWGLTDQNCLVEDPATGNIRVTNSACETQMELQSDGSYWPRFGADVNQTFYHHVEAGKFILEDRCGGNGVEVTTRHHPWRGVSAASQGCRYRCASRCDSVAY